MSSRRRGARAAPIAVMIGISPLTSFAAAPGGSLARCTGIAAPDARLACYDALAGRAADHVDSVTPAPTAAPTQSASAAAAPAGTTPASAGASPAPASDPRNFGLTEAQQHGPAQREAPKAPSAIEARIAKFIDNRAGRPYVVLDNGQTWIFVDTDGDAQLSPGDTVTIKKASLGSFLMLTQARHSYRVRRTQ